jgi:hypothetical protein
LSDPAALGPDSCPYDLQDEQGRPNENIEPLQKSLPDTPTHRGLLSGNENTPGRKSGEFQPFLSGNKK